MSVRKICIVTGSRADYGLLHWLMKEVQSDPELELQVVATGAHLSPEFGLTYRAIEADGFRIDAKVEMLLSSDSRTGVAKSMGKAVIGFADALEQLSPDIVVLLGDRYEILAAAETALIANIPLAHIHGGEVTEGAMDDAIRHAVTKMSHLHFVAAEPYRRRVIQLGEDPAMVFNFGATAVDNIQRLELFNRAQLEQALGFNLGDQCFLVTYHPVTLGKHSAATAMGELLAALDGFPAARLIFTRPNADPGNRSIVQMIDEFVGRNPRATAFDSLGTQRYLSAIANAAAVIGNSSSGLIEAPFLKTPTVNLGERQSGRLRAASVIDCAEQRDEITAAINKALSPAFRATLHGVVSPYGTGNVAARIKDKLKSVPLDNILIKKFHDL